MEIRVDLREAAEQQIFLHRYDPSLCALVERICRPGDNVVDVGANVGVITATAANAVGPEGQVVAIEPNPKLARRLRELGNRNSLENTHVVECALGEKEDVLPFYISSSHPYSALDPNYLPDYPVDGVIEVPVRTLDAVLSERIGKRHIRLMKLDAQGYENRIIQGMRSTLKATPPDLIVLEAVTRGLEFTLADLKASGYETHTLSEAGELTHCEANLPVEGTNVVFVHATASRIKASKSQRT